MGKMAGSCSRASVYYAFMTIGNYASQAIPIILAEIEDFKSYESTYAIYALAMINKDISETVIIIQNLLEELLNNAELIYYLRDSGVIASLQVLGLIAEENENNIM